VQGTQSLQVLKLVEAPETTIGGISHNFSFI
jgi:hypothetical protein